MGRLTIGIASIGRPSLQRTLRSLQEIDPPDGMSVEIVVLDDDPGGAAARLVEREPEGRLPVRVLAVGARNVATARNACLDAAAGDLVAFVDDDEWVARDWLLRLVAARAEFGADVVVGPVYPVYPAGTPDWLVRANPLQVDWGRRGRRLVTGRGGNVLFRRADPRWSAVRFDPALGRTGGEDTDFFHRLHLAGAVIVATDDARIEEDVPAARLEPARLRHRALRSGQSYARVRLAGGRGFDAPGLAFNAGAAAKTMAGFAAALALLPVDRARALRFAQKGWLNLGKLRQLAGLDLPTSD